MKRREERRRLAELWPKNTSHLQFPAKVPTNTVRGVNNVTWWLMISYTVWECCSAEFQHKTGSFRHWDRILSTKVHSFKCSLWQYNAVSVESWQDPSARSHLFFLFSTLHLSWVPWTRSHIGGSAPAQVANLRDPACHSSGGCLNTLTAFWGMHR